MCAQVQGVQDGSGEEWRSCDSSKLNRKRKASRETGGRPSKRRRMEEHDGYEGEDEESDYELVRVSKPYILSCL